MEIRNKTKRIPEGCIEIPLEKVDYMYQPPQSHTPVVVMKQNKNKLDRPRGQSELRCMKCGSKENLNTNKDKSFVECDECMWGIEKDGTRLADEFYSLAPRYRTKVKLQEMIDKWLDKAREEGKLEYILSLGWQDTNNEYVKEVLEDADRIANELSKLKDNK